MTELPRYPADPIWHRVKGVPERHLFETKLVRACDLRWSDVIRVGKDWVDIFEVWQQGDRPAETWGDSVYRFSAQLGRNQTYAEFISDIIDWSIDTWIVVRWYDRNKSNAAEAEDQLLKLYKFELVEVQIPSAVQEGNPLD